MVVKKKKGRKEERKWAWVIKCDLLRLWQKIVIFLNQGKGISSLDTLYYYYCCYCFY